MQFSAQSPQPKPSEGESMSFFIFWQILARIYLQQVIMVISSRANNVDSGSPIEECSKQNLCALWEICPHYILCNSRHTMDSDRALTKME